MQTRVCVNIEIFAILADVIAVGGSAIMSKYLNFTNL